MLIGSYMFLVILRQLSQVVDKELVKKDVFDKLAKNVNSTDTNALVKKTDYNAIINKIKGEVSISGLVLLLFSMLLKIKYLMSVLLSKNRSWCKNIRHWN